MAYPHGPPPPVPASPVAGLPPVASPVWGPPVWGPTAWGPPAWGPTAWGPSTPAPPRPPDPEPRRSSKATAVLVLGILGVCLMLCGGGAVPGALALAMSGPARAEIEGSEGFLTGSGMIRTGRVLSWVAVVVGAMVLVGIAVLALLDLADRGSTPTYGDTVD